MRDKKNQQGHLADHQMQPAHEKVRRFKGPKRFKTGKTPLRIPVGAPRWSFKKQNETIVNTKLPEFLRQELQQAHENESV